MAELARIRDRHSEEFRVLAALVSDALAGVDDVSDTSGEDEVVRASVVGLTRVEVDGLAVAIDDAVSRVRARSLNKDKVEGGSRAVQVLVR